MTTQSLPFIPNEITVHLGPPDSDAPNVTLPFADYIKNVASSELYPTWPENALRANIIAQVTFLTVEIRSKLLLFHLKGSQVIISHFAVVSHLPTTLWKR